MRRIAAAAGADGHRNLPRSGRRHCDGRGAQSGRVERLLPEAGESLDDLRRDVEHFQHRMALKAAVAAMPAFEAERSTLEEKIAAANKLLEAAEKQHREVSNMKRKLADLDKQRTQLEQRMRKSDI
jgi:predicted RNase H-like nuclease (RuvC/YqgF family)